MNDTEMQHAFDEMAELWPGWDPRKAVRGLFARKLRFMRPDWLHQAIEDVAMTYASTEPRVAWFFKAYDKFKKVEGDVQKIRHSESERICRAQDDRTAREDQEMMTRQLKAMSDDDRRICVDRVNSMRCFDNIPGTDVERWSTMQRGLVWGRWQIDLEKGEGVAA